MRLRVRRRKMLNVTIKVLGACFVTLIFYLCMRPHSRSTVAKEKCEVRTKIFIVEREIEAISMLHNMTEAASSLSSSGTLISISSHFTNKDIVSSVKQFSVEAISAAVTGLFGKIIWIYPMWVPNSNIFSTQRQSLGVNSISNQMCICSVVKNGSYTNVSLCEDALPAAAVEEASCRLIDNEWEMLSMQEIYALVSLADIGLSVPVVVNINLDFFTVERRKSLPIDRAIEDQIETGLNSLFCVHSPAEELLVDAWFHRLVEHWTLAASIDRLLETTGMPMAMACQSKISLVKYRIKMLITEFKKLTDTQLKALDDSGICIADRLSKEQNNHGVHKLKLCNSYAHSKHSEWSPRRQSHSCADIEFILQIEKIVKILQDSIKSPTIISIVRSSRTGIVSHRNQNFLENQLLWKLKSIYHIQSSDIIYHRNLLGGAHGWWFRHHRNSSNDTIAQQSTIDNS